MTRVYYMLVALVVATGILGAHAAQAAGKHEGGHAEPTALGEPGDPKKPARVVPVTMKEADGKMLFFPDRLKVRAGEQIRFKLRNAGELEHEFVLGTSEQIVEHHAAMQKFPGMEHEDPQSIRLEPGANGEIVWKFSNVGNFEFACLIPGHLEAGMKGTVTVSK